MADIPVGITAESEKHVTRCMVSRSVFDPKVDELRSDWALLHAGETGHEVLVMTLTSTYYGPTLRSEL